MKKTGLILVLAASLLNLASAQTINITGTVKTLDGDFLHLAFVQDSHYKNGVYTDSLGSFSLTVHQDSKLKVICRGYRDTLISVNNQTTFAIIMSPVVNIVAKRSNITPQADDHNNINFSSMSSRMTRDEPSVANTHQVYVDKTYASTGHTLTVTLTSGGDLDMAQGAVFPVFHHKDAMEGSKYLFNDWMHGYVVKMNDSTIQSPGLFFNYDKIGGNLLMSQDKHAAIEVFKDQIRSFTLFDELNQAHTFAIVPDIDKTHFVQVIAEGNNYKIYKAVKTKFVAANYSSDGIASTGNNFDSYEDEFTYYLLNVKTNQLQKISLRKKALKQAFVADGTKIDSYFKTNDGDVDDNYLASLGDYMNK